MSIHSMSIIKRYEEAKKILKREPIQLNPTTRAVEGTVSAEEQKALGFCLALMSGLHTDHPEHLMEVYKVVLPYARYIEDQLMLMMCKGEEIPAWHKSYVWAFNHFKI